jgi:hypothetical protein
VCESGRDLAVAVEGTAALVAALHVALDLEALSVVVERVERRGGE